jgi:RES domain-containing protein
MLADPELRRALAAGPLIEITGPWVRAIDARLLTASPPGAPAGSPPQPLWGGGARMYGGRFTPKGSFDTLYLSSDLITVGLEIGAVFGTSGAVSPAKDPFTVVTAHP